MVYTCSYKDFNTELYKGVSISKDKGKDAGWKKECYLDLAPKKDFFRIWKNNRGKISDEKNNLYYINEFYNKILAKLDPFTIYNNLSNSFLLCYENNDEFCHRHIVAAWLELYLNIEIKEVAVDGLLIMPKEKPLWIKETLEKVIKENTNMRGFNNIRALYLLNQSEIFEREAEEKEKLYNKSYSALRQAACYMRCEADMAEEEYNNSKKVKRLIKK